jgi:hypothetical protein
MSSPEEISVVARLAVRHGLSDGAVKEVLRALRAGGGTMAQFTHPEFGGMAQWSPGMTMVGDMFNDRLKVKLEGVATALAAFLREQADRSASEHVSAPDQPDASSWPPEFGAPSTSGAQNQMRYAFFPSSRRLVIEDSGVRAVYDTGDHHIQGVSQSQSSSTMLAFRSQHGVVDVQQLRRVS